LVRFFDALDLIDHTAVTVAAIGEIPRSRRILPDHRPAVAIRLVAPHAGVVAGRRSGSTELSVTLAGVATAVWISWVRLSTPKCPFMPK